MEIVNFIKKIQHYALSSPDKVLFVDENGTRKTTNAQFWLLTQQIAALISQRLQGREHLFIPIFLKDSMEYFASEMAIWMTGNASVHMGLSFPQERVDYIMHHCEAEFMIDGEFIAASGQLQEGCTDIRPRTPDQPCAMFYTSGSTGNPKGVLHSDAGFMHSITRFDQGFSLKGYKTFASTASCYFVVLVTTYSMMLQGSELHILAPEVRRDVHLLEDYIAEHEIEFANISPSLLRVYQNKAKSLKVIKGGGERLVGCYSKDYTVLNTFGQTETAGPVFIKPLDKHYDNAPIGKPTPGVEIVLLDDEGKEVLQGEVGELCFKSGMHSPVYYKDPERTAALTAGGVQHTGDLVKLLPNGDVLYVQRKDWMVKINGLRVEPGEVENVMRHIPGVKDAIVKGFTTDDLTRQYLVGYYILEEDAALDADGIKAGLRKKMPEYMVPQYMVKMDAFPLNANNKVDRKSLLPPDLSTMQSDYVAPTNDVERALCDAFAKVLKMERVGIDDDFTLIGGDSIRTMMLQQLFNDEYADRNWGVLSASIINLGRTPKKIAEELAKSVNYVFKEMDDYPLNTSQLRYVKLSIEHPDEPIGILAYRYRLDDSIDLDRLAKALEKVTAAHKVFGIRMIEKEPGIYRQQFIDIPVKITPEMMTDEQLAQSVNDLSAPVIALNHPLFKLRVIEAPSGKFFLMKMHHSIYDGFSHRILMRDIALAYDGESVPKEEWSQLEIAQMEQQFKQSDKCVTANKWFEEQLQDVSHCLPDPDVMAEVPQAASKEFTLRITPDELSEAAQKMNATINVYTTTVYARLIGKYAGLNKVAIWLPYASRDDYRSQNTVGELVNGFIMNTSWEKGGSLRDHLQQTNMYFSHAMSYIYADKPYVDASHIVSFLFQGERRNPMVGGKTMKSLATDKKAEFLPTPIQVKIFLDYTKSNEGHVIAQAIYYAHLYSEEFIQRLVEDFGNMLKNE